MKFPVRYQTADGKIGEIANEEDFKKFARERYTTEDATVPYDPRFPNTNQTKNCYQNYLDYFRCKKVKGEDYAPCHWYKWAYSQLCPIAWHKKWDEQRENGIFPGRI